MNIGFWCKDNKVIDISYNKHIHYVLEHLSEFNLTEAYVKKIFKKHNEGRRVEGKAREEIIKELSKDGWVRVRKYNEYWSIQFDNYVKRKRTVKNFIEAAILDLRVMRTLDYLILIGFEDGTNKEMLAKKYIAESVSVKKYANLKVLKA